MNLPNRTLFTSFRTWAALSLALTFAVGCGPHSNALDPMADSGTADGYNPITDVTLDKPATLEDGWQFDIPAFPVDAGAEIQQCFFFTVPVTDQASFVNHIEIAQTTGTHHMNIFRVRTVKNLDGENGALVSGGECWKPTNWSDWPLVINSQNEGHVDVELPDGVAHRFEPGEKLMLQTHYVNATTQMTPGVGRILVNFNRTHDTNVQILGTAFATNQNIKICPGDTNVQYQTTCTFARNDVTIFAANGHFHSRGRTFKMSVFDPAGEEKPPFYESHNWAEPVFERGLHEAVPAQGGIRYSCDFTAAPTDCGDPANGCCFTFGGMVEFQEHCNAFVYYYPANGTTDVNCF